MRAIITFCALITFTVAQPTGCSGTEKTVVANKVYACSGTFPSGQGGMFGVAEALCADGYHVCTSVIEAENLGYTDALCQSIVGQNEFFGSQETSDGNMHCFSYRGGSDRTKYNDIWGCAKAGSEYTTATLGWSYVDDCGEFSAWVGQNRGWGNGAWTYTADWKQYEAIDYGLSNAAYGGVLCCVDPCAAVGASYTPSHECRCQSQCSGDRFCHGLDKVQSALGEASASGYCETGTCCCSCSDCDGFTDYLAVE